MGLAVLLFAGGLLFWMGLGSGQRGWLLSGGSLLLIPFAGMVASGSIAPTILPMLAGLGCLTWALKTQRCPTHACRVATGLVYLLIILALGVRQFPGLTPFPLLDVSGKQVLFPPEKRLLFALVPPLVLTPLLPDGW